MSRDLKTNKVHEDKKVPWKYSKLDHSPPNLRRPYPSLIHFSGVLETFLVYIISFFSFIHYFAVILKSRIK